MEQEQPTRPSIRGYRAPKAIKPAAPRKSASPLAACLTAEQIRAIAELSERLRTPSHKLVRRWIEEGLTRARGGN